MIAVHHPGQRVRITPIKGAIPLIITQTVALSGMVTNLWVTGIFLNTLVALHIKQATLVILDTRMAWDIRAQNIPLVVDTHNISPLLRIILQGIQVKIDSSRPHLGLIVIKNHTLYPVFRPKGIVKIYRQTVKVPLIPTHKTVREAPVMI